MVYKLLDSFLATCVERSNRNHRNFLLQLRTPGKILHICGFCSGSDQNDSSDSSKNPTIESLLRSSSPLRLSEESDNDLWATSPYPAGTVFRETESARTYDQNTDDFSKNSIILFPGQGNQFVGMAKNLMKYPVALDMFNTANEMLKYNLLKICLEGPEKLLNDTEYCQPATFVCSLALLEKLKEERPWAISNCVATCGYSLGELTALVFAGCMNFEKGLKLVRERAKAMALCCKKTQGGMLTIFTGPRTTLSTALSEAVEHCKSKGIENPQCAVASYLYPNCKVISGNEEALTFIINGAKKYNIRRYSKLPVAGAFHTLLMKDAAESFKATLKQINLEKPIVKVFSNVTGLPYKNEEHILNLLSKQIYSPVKWEQTLQNILLHRRGAPLPYFYECGPGKSLIATLEKVNNQAAPTSFAIQL